MGVTDTNTKYVVTITAKGKPSVSIECYDPLGAAEAVGRILRTYATIDTPAAPEARPEPPRPEHPSSAPPVCGVHRVPMVGMTGGRTASSGRATNGRPTAGGAGISRPSADRLADGQGAADVRARLAPPRLAGTSWKTPRHDILALPQT